MNLNAKNTVRLIGLLWMPLLAMAADSVPATLPKGFLEKLPVLSQLSDKEFNQLLALAKTQQTSTPKAVKVSAQQD